MFRYYPNHSSCLTLVTRSPTIGTTGGEAEEEERGPFNPGTVGHINL